MLGWHNQEAVLTVTPLTQLQYQDQADVVADSTTDTLTFVAGSGMTITTDAGSDTITLASSGGGATTLNALTDVSASSPSSGQVLKYNGSAWAPAADLNSGAEEQAPQFTDSN